MVMRLMGSAAIYSPLVYTIRHYNTIRCKSRSMTVITAAMLALQGVCNEAKSGGKPPEKKGMVGMLS